MMRDEIEEIYAVHAVQHKHWQGARAIFV